MVSFGPFTATSTLSLSLDLAQLAVLRDLEIGFAAPLVSGLGFGSLEFTLTVEGSSVLDMVFVNPLAALAYFDDQVLDFGPIGSGVTGTLDVQASFILTSANPGSVFSTQLSSPPMPRRRPSPRQRCCSRPARPSSARGPAGGQCAAADPPYRAAGGVTFAPRSR